MYAPKYLPRDRFGNLTSNIELVYDWLVQAAMNGRSVNLRVSDTVCHPNGYPLIASLRIFP